MIRANNPYTCELVAEYPRLTDDQLIQWIAEAATCQRDHWRELDIATRVGPLRRAAELLRAEAEEHATLMAREMGKPISEGRKEVEKCAWVCEHYADHAQAMLDDRSVPTDAASSYIAFRPLGTVLAVMPWNFPFWQVFRAAIPALAAGNAVLLKHAGNVPGCALAIEDLLGRSGLPPALFRALLIPSEDVARVIENPRVSAVTLTGSVAAGRAVAAQAGRCLKKTVLELGGSDPYVILADADLDHAAEQAVTSRLINSGQSCIAAKRFIADRSIHDAFVDRVVSKMSQVSPGDPLDDDTRLGPMARHDLRDELHRQVEASIAAGAKAAVGGEIPDHKGALYPATVLVNVGPGMPAYDEELFGPVAAIICADGEADALRIANDSSFGLGAAIFTRDVERGERLAADHLEAGSCFVNTFVRSDPRLPFGGIKDSGYGRELGSLGITEFVNAKTIYIAGE